MKLGRSFEEAPECEERSTPVKELLLPSNLATIPRRSGRRPGVLTVMISAVPRVSHLDILQPPPLRGKNGKGRNVFATAAAAYY